MIRSVAAVALAGACLLTGTAMREPVSAASGSANITLEVLVESDVNGAAIEAISISTQEGLELLGWLVHATAARAPAPHATSMWTTIGWKPPASAPKRKRT